MKHPHLKVIMDTLGITLNDARKVLDMLTVLKYDISKMTNRECTEAIHHAYHHID